MLDAPVTDGIVSLMIGVLSVVDRVLGGVVDLSAGEPLTALGSGSVRVMAEIAINMVKIIAALLERLAISI